MNQLAHTILRTGPEDFELAREAMTEVHRRPLLDHTALENFLSDLGSYLFLAMENGRVVGSLNGHAITRPATSVPQFLLYEIDVRENFRGRGVGKSLVNAFIDLARSAGASEIWVLANQSNTAAIRLYQSCGFSRPNSDDVLFTLSLEKSDTGSQ